jgi:hypothetical protein
MDPGGLFFTTFRSAHVRTVKFIKDFESYKADDHVEVDDQVACDAIASGAAVPSVDAIEAPQESPAAAVEPSAEQPAAETPAAEQAAFEPATENRALDGAPEVK